MFLVENINFFMVKSFGRKKMVLYLSNSLHLTCFLDSPENQKLEVYSEILEVMFQGSFC